MNGARVHGLLLSGGQSQRMGTDKGLIAYAGQTTEIERWKAIFEALALPLYWSQRPQQYPRALFPHIDRIVDQHPGSGPLGALISAARAYPGQAWLVLACDWPLLGLDDVQTLLERRRPEKAAASYVVDGRRQPLCSLYEPLFLEEAFEAWERGERSLHRLLEKALVEEVEPRDETRFRNVNDSLQRQEVEAQIRSALSPRHDHRNDR